MNEQQRNRIGDYAVWALLFLSTGAISGMVIGPEALQSGSSSASTSQVLEILMGAIYLVLFALLVPIRRKAMRLLQQERWMLVFLLFVMASAIWSVDRGETFRRSLGLLGTTLAGLYIGVRYEPRRILRMLGICIGVAAVLSLVVCLLIPGIGATQDGSWQGVFYPKNTLGRIMCLGIFSYIFLTIGQKRRQLWPILMIVLCGSLLLMSRSATALVASLILLSLIFVRRALYWPVRRLIVTGAVLTVVAVPVMSWSTAHVTDILGVFGRDQTATGRLPLWHAVRTEIADRPLLGYGYAAFWTSSDADYWRQQLEWDAPNAHNGFLEMALGVGYVGMGIFLLGLFRNVRLGFRIARERGRIEDAWPLFFFVFCILYNLTESTLFGGNSVFWVLYSANTYWLVKTDLQPVTEEEDESEPSAELAAGNPVSLDPA